MLGAVPTTVTASSVKGLIWMVTGDPSRAVMSTGRATWPPGSTTIT
jgi:hypothetical protein